MFWRIMPIEPPESPLAGGPHEGRFVLHRHRDDGGEHLDLRLERGGFLYGWRIDGLRLEDEAWATEKAAHPLRWLDEDEEAAREDAGLYAWERSGPDGGVLLLEGRQGRRRIRIERERGLAPREARAICAALEGAKAESGQAARLIEDGACARARAEARLIGLGRELDGGAFDEAVWRKTLRPLSLDEIHSQLRSFEVRFDLKYPPCPTSRPAALSEEGAPDRADEALSILRA